jgi:hypothetical protein
VKWFGISKRRPATARRHPPRSDFGRPHPCHGQKSDKRGWCDLPIPSPVGQPSQTHGKKPAGPSPHPTMRARSRAWRGFLQKRVNFPGSPRSLPLELDQHVENIRDSRAKSRPDAPGPTGGRVPRRSWGKGSTRRRCTTRRGRHLQRPGPRQVGGQPNRPAETGRWRFRASTSSRR